MKILKKIATLFTPKKTKSKETTPTQNKQKPQKQSRAPQQKSTYRKKHSPRKPKRTFTPQKTEPPKYNGKAFSEMDLHPDLIKKLNQNEFTHATEVQEKSIPITLSGKNIFCSSETGSGKTLSFLLPMIHKFYTNELDQALIICPTREIAIQIQKTLKLFGDESLTSALVIGGTNIELQKEYLRQYPKILIATPGRLLDMLNTGLIWLQYTGYVVLDEADRMLDMGFEEELNEINRQLTGEHQKILFSATLFPEIKKMAARYAKSYEEIVIGNPTSVAGSVEHLIVEMPAKEKFFALKHLIRYNPGKMMVFFNTIKDTMSVTSQLKKHRVRQVECIHSKIDQQGRERLITNFREGKISVLLASDVAARGIDIPNVELVVNFDVPNNSEEYIHRVGRTGRAGKSGIAVSFYTPTDTRDTKKLQAVEKLIKTKIKRRHSYKGIV